MKLLADGVWQLTGFPRAFLNAYLVGDVLIDTGTRWARSRIARQIQGRPLHLVALTHCHPDHQESVTFAGRTRRVLRTKVPDPLLNHAPKKKLHEFS